LRIAFHDDALPLYAARLPLAIDERFWRESFEPWVMRQPAAPVEVCSAWQLLTKMMFELGLPSAGCSFVMM
jgi:hypothetical protein